jgi:crossover junction endodeoxyribonuclease RuvC
MKIMGIDPGYGRCGVCVIDAAKRPETVLFSDCIETKGSTDMFERFKIVSDAVTSAINLYQPEVIALEKLFFDKNTKTAINVAQVRGALMMIAAQKNLALFEYTPAQIKVAVTGYGKATKRDVIFMIPKLVQSDKISSGVKIIDDEYDAIATALTCSASENFSN